MWSIYVYLLWGCRQQELSNTLVECLEDLRIKLKPTEVSYKSCCASFTACMVYLVLDTVKYSSWKTWKCSMLSAFPGLGTELQQRSHPTRNYCSTAGESHLGGSWEGRPCASQAVPEASRELVPAPWVGADGAWAPLNLCLHLYESWIPKAWSWVSLPSKMILLWYSEREVSQGLLQYKLLELFFQSLLGTQGCQGLDAFVCGMSSQ